MIKPVFSVSNDPQVRRIVVNHTSHSVERMNSMESEDDDAMHFNFRADSPEIRRAASNSPSECCSTLKKMIKRIDQNPVEPSSF
jgi:hypothetical protein